MTRIATAWLVYRLTGSAFLLGVVGFAGQFPSFVLAPFAGVLIDRWDRHRLLIATQVLALLQSLAIAVLTLGDWISFWQVLVLAVMQGLINAFDMPTRQALMVELIEKKEDLSNAIAINSSMVNAARLLGPSIGGVIIAAVGEGWCFMIDALSYVPVVVSLLMMRIVPKPRNRSQEKQVLHDLREGLAYVGRSRTIRSILMLLAIVSLVGMPYTVLMPVFANEVLHGGPNALGLLMAATGVGALDWRTVFNSPQKRVGTGQVYPHRGRPVRCGVGAVFLVTQPLVFAADSRTDWFWVHYSIGGQQHAAADDRRRRQTRPRDELLCDGLHGDSPLRQFAGWRGR